MSSTGRTDTASIVIADVQTTDVFRAFVDPESVMAWLPPGNMSGRALEYEFHEGGRYRIELTYAGDSQTSPGKTSARTDVSSGRFLAVEPEKRIVQSVEFESDDAAFAGEMLLSWSFEAVRDGTRVTITAENVPPGISEADHQAGLQSSLGNLARFLEEAA